jgi:hypothetical protein
LKDGNKRATDSLYRLRAVGHQADQIDGRRGAIPPLLPDLTVGQLMERARHYRRAAAINPSVDVRNALNVLAVRFAMIAARRDPFGRHDLSF